MQSGLDNLTGTVDSVSGTVSSLEGNIQEQDSRIGTLEANENKEGPDCYMTKASEQYTLHIRSNKRGAFVPRVTLLATEVYSLNTTGEAKAAHIEFSEKFTGVDFVPGLRWDTSSGRWEIASAVFYGGNITVEAGTEWSEKIDEFEVPADFKHDVFVELLTGVA